MTSKKMLIDTTHPEETRVAVLSGSRIEDFEVEAADRKQLKGNIYLAKVTRVEPSLQAAFVEYGGNRHGFLAFSEIHPDYYQIPVADREALMAEQHAADREAAAAADAEDEDDTPRPAKGRRRKATTSKAPANEAIANESEGGDTDGGAANGGETDNGEANGESATEVDVNAGGDGEEAEVRRPRQSLRNYKIQEVIKRRQIMLVQVVKEERGSKGAALTTILSLAGRYCVLMPNTGRGGGISRKIASGTDRKRLKTILGELDIPEGMAVIVRTAGAKRNKTEIKRDCNYLLRLWESVRELTLQSIAPALVYEEANLIKRTIRDLYASDIDEIVVDGESGFQTAKTFIKLLMPSHIKRVKLHPAEDVPLFQAHGVEAQLHGIFRPDVPLKSGGYIVINPTEALVSIDVNSGRATRERNIEETALRTNLEASDEVARQLRLREMAGLIVIDYIDMEHSRNQMQVERRLKTAMRNDRARIQIGRISPFGLMELSRQRLHPSLLETCFEPFPHAAGVGYRRTVPSSALAALRAIEEEGAKGIASDILVHLPTAVTVYIANYKRVALAAIEARHEMVVRFAADDSLTAPEVRIERTITRAEPRPPIVVRPIVENPTEADVEEDADADEADVEVEFSDTESDEGQGESEVRERPAAAGDDGFETAPDGTKRRRRRRSRRRRGGERDSVNGQPHRDSESGPHETQAEDATSHDHEAAAAEDGSGDQAPATQADGDEQDRSRRRRRGRRGGRRRPREGAELAAAAADGEQPAYYEPLTATTEATGEAIPAEDGAAAGERVEGERAEGERPPRRRRGRRPRSANPDETISHETMETPATSDSAEDAVEGIAIVPPPPAGPRPYWATRPPVTGEAAAQPAPEVRHEPEVRHAPEPITSSVAEATTEARLEDIPAPAPEDPDVVVVERIDPAQPRRSGWWKRMLQS